MAFTHHRVDVNRAAVARIFQPGGQGWSANRQWARTAQEIAERTGPKRSRVLVNSFDTEQGRARGRFASAWVLVNTAPHALYVTGGTGPVITANNPFGMAVPRQRRMDGARGADLRGGARFWTDQVRGQRPNPFIERACEAAALQFGLPQ